MTDIISGGLGIISGITGMNAANKAAGEQAGAIQNALNFQQGVYGTATNNLSPYIGTGTNALASIAQLYGLPAPAGSNLPAGNALNAYKAYTQTPAYTFPLQQGEQALDQSAAARGLTLSGGQANTLQQYATNYASGNFNNYMNALGSLANLGQSSSTQLGQLGNTAASTTLQGETGLGNALAAGTIGAQNQLNNALGGVNQLLGGFLPSNGGNSSSYVDSGSFNL